LEACASRCKAPVQFLGAIYDEERLAGLFMNCLAVVSPGKVGLLAIHAMAYGAPVITHDDFDRQMPEVEAIRSPNTGRLFRRGDLDGLCEAMSHYLTAPAAASERQEAINAIEERYTPQAQRRLIEAALDQLLDTGTPP
jgi:glycosyltransferase involved in cell wall biosynthesis